MGINSVCDTIQLDSGRQLVLGLGEKRLRMRAARNVNIIASFTGNSAAQRDFMFVNSTLG